MLKKLANDIAARATTKLAASPSYLNSALGGLDPTGLITFGVGQQEEDRSRDKWHKLMGATAGTLGGAGLLPAIAGAGVSLYEDAGKIKNAPGARGKLLAALSSMGEGAISPFKSLYNWGRLSRNIGSKLETGKATPGDLAEIFGEASREIAGMDPGILNILAGKMDRNSVEGTGIMAALKRKGIDVTNAINSRLWGAIKDSPINLDSIGVRDPLQKLQAQANRGIASMGAGIGLSAGVGGLSTLGQYNAGADSGEKLRELQSWKPRVNINLPNVSGTVNNSR